jgi:hypothetical protein
MPIRASNAACGATGCPTFVRRIGWIAPLALAAGCFPFPEPPSFTNTYGGIGSVEVAGRPPLALAHESVSITSCEVPRRSGGGYVMFAVLAIGERCSLEGAWDRGTFRAKTGGECTLPIPGREITIHVTDVVVRRPMFGARFGPEADNSSVDVQIGGTAATDRSPSEYVAFRFSGSLEVTADATRTCTDRLARDEPNATTRLPPPS